jgi:hypothetical protein
MEARKHRGRLDLSLELTGCVLLRTLAFLCTVTDVWGEVGLPGRTMPVVWQRKSSYHTVVRASTTRTTSKPNAPPETNHACKNRSLLNPDTLCITLPPRKDSPDILAVQGVSLTKTKAKVILKTPSTATQAAAKPTVSDQGMQAASSSPATRSLPRRASRETEMAWSHRFAVAEAG